MILTVRDLLTAFTRKHANARKSVAAWVAEVEQASWSDSHAIKARYPSADPIGANRVVFKPKVNDYRLIVVVQYGAGVVAVRFIGTHPDYDRIDATKV